MALTTSVKSLNNEDKIIIDYFGSEREVRVICTGDNQFDENGQYKPDGFALSEKEIAVLNDFLKNVRIENFRAEITEYCNERYEEDDEDPISEEMMPSLVRINEIAVNVCKDDDDDQPEIAFMGECHCDQEGGICIGFRDRKLVGIDRYDCLLSGGMTTGSTDPDLIRTTGNIDLDLIKEIAADEEFAESAGDAMVLNFFEDPQPLSEYNDEELDGDYTFSEDGIVFAEDGGGGFYILLEDGSVGYANPAEDECGRPAENLRDFLELMLNTRYDWENYIQPRFVKDPELVRNYVEDYEKKGLEQFTGVYGDKYPSYDELIKKIGERFGLRISEDISEDILPKLFKAVMREPEFTVIMDEEDMRLETLGFAVRGSEASAPGIPTVAGFEFEISDDGELVVTKYDGDDTNAVIPDGVTVIGDNAFEDCESLTSVTIPDGVTVIGDYAFGYCRGLTSVTLPDSVTVIGKGAFSHCENLTSVALPDSVTVIERCAFSGCSSLESVTIPNGVTVIETNTFEDCKNLTSVIIPDSVTVIRSQAFCDCSSLTDVVIPNSVTKIESWSFQGCSGLKSLTIPNSVTEMEHDFIGCRRLESVTVHNFVPLFAFSGFPKLTQVTLSDDVTRIEKYAFNECSSLKSIIIPNSVTEIGDSAFRGCTSLESIVIPDGVTEIENNTFNKCSSLTSVTIPNSVTRIGEDAFRSCSKLESVIIPDSVTEIESDAFYTYSSLTKVTYKGKTYDQSNMEELYKAAGE